LIPFFFTSVALSQGAGSDRVTKGATETPQWTSWRGPLGTGSASQSKPPTHWAEQTADAPAKNIAWKVPIPGLGISSPIVWQNQIYLTTAIETDRDGKSVDAGEPQNPLAEPRRNVVFEFALMALDRSDGGVIWQRTLAEVVPHEGGHRTNSHASGSPVTDGQHVYVNFGSRGVYCMTLTGELVWSKQLGIMQTRRDYGEGSSPALYENYLIVNFDHEGESFLVVLDKHSGKELWRRPREEVTSWSTPVVAVVDGRPQIVINATTASRGYDLSNGKVIWSLPGMTVNCIPIPVVTDGIAYLMSGYRGQMLQAVQLKGAKGDLAGSASLKWDHRKNTSYVPSAALYDGLLYFVRGNTAVLSCLDAKTGKVHYEGQRLPGLRKIYSSPVCAAGHLYITSRDGVTAVIDHGKSFQPPTVSRLDEDVDASPAIVGDEIYMRGREHLYCLANRTTEEEHPAAVRKRTKAPDKPVAENSHVSRSGSLGKAMERTASISTGDLDSDGDLDFVVANGRHWAGQNRVFINGGEGSFGDQHILSADQSTSYSTAIGDLDSDGDLDVLEANDRAPSYVLLNDGSGHFIKGQQVGRISNTRSVTLADLDGQNGLDVIFVNRNESNLICFNDGKGHFGRQVSLGAKADSTINVAVADFDGDGDLDIAAANRKNQQNYIYLNDGHGGFGPAVPYGTGSDSTRGIAVADFDKDGHMDILNANIKQPNAIYFGDGKAKFDRSLQFGGENQSYTLATGDIDHDGSLDIVVGNAAGPNMIYLQRAGGTFLDVPFGGAISRTYGIVVADWNGDGHPEIATANSDGLNYLYEWSRD
jgi:hypothetical protein